MLYYLVHYCTCSSGSLWVASWTPECSMRSVIYCAPLSHLLEAFCWAEQQNHHLSQQEDRTRRYSMLKKTDSVYTVCVHPERHVIVYRTVSEN